MDRPRISLIVCTRNRAIRLGRCLDAIDGADYSSTKVELIIVDNGSTDETAAVIRRFLATTSIPAHSIKQPVVGLSYARNAGVAAAHGEVLAFTDDDCYVARDYFSALTEAFRDCDFDYSGGRILLHEPSDAFHACNDSGLEGRVRPHTFIYAGWFQGANMAFTRELFEAVGQFDSKLGAGTPFRCEDVDYIARASQAGFVGAHVPSVVVYHHHGIKDGDNLEQAQRDNDYARGAYYVKRFLAGNWSVPYRWARMTLAAPHHHIATELRGAFHYLLSRVRSTD